MSGSNTILGLPARLQFTRKMRGISQKQLAELADVSESLISKIERDAVQDVRLETVHKLASALRITTTDLLVGRGDTEDTSGPNPELWEATRRALIGRLGQPEDPPTVEGVGAELDALKPLLTNNRYAEIATILPRLLRDADALNDDGRTIRSRLLNTTGWVLTQNRQFDVAEPTLRQAIDTANDRLDAAAAVNTLVWLYLRQGLFADAQQLATSWADEIEPRFSRATVQELTLWGRLLLGVSNAAIRDNRPGIAEDSLKLARAAAARIGRETLSDTSTTRTFGPITVAMISAENAAVMDQPGKVLEISKRIPTIMPHATSASRNRHRLDVASALTKTHKSTEALAILRDLARVSPEWLSVQRYARDILLQVIGIRRDIDDEIREIADAVGLEY